MAYNAINEEYLVVWMYEADPTNKPDVYEIWGQVIPLHGYVGDEFQIITWPNRSFWTPRVAWNSYRNEYLVIWNAMNTQVSFPPGVPNDIAGYRISSTGTVTPSSLSITTSYPHHADLAYNVALDGYLVVWVRSYSAATTGEDVYGAYVEWDGDVVNLPGEFAISNTSKDEYSPAVATNGQNRYVVAWEREWSVTDMDVVAANLGTSGNVVTQLFVATTLDDETNPDVAAAFGTEEDYFFVWQQSTASGEEVRGWRWAPPTSTEPFAIESVAFWEMENPAVAIGAPGYLIAYEGDSIGDPTEKRWIYGRIWWPEAAFVPLAMRQY